MHYAYVMQNTEGILYKGSTDNLEKRLEQHNFGTFPGYTKSRRPWKLVHKEGFATRKEAEAREKYLKTSRGREFLKKVIQ